jgi:hypothetical protein
LPRPLNIGLLIACCCVVLKQLMSGYVTGIHAWNGMVHQQSRIKFRHASGGRDGAEALAKIVAPLGPHQG